MNRTCAAMLLLYAACAAPQSSSALTLDPPGPAAHRSSLTAPTVRDALSPGDAIAPPPPLLLTAPPDLAVEPHLLARLDPARLDPPPASADDSSIWLLDEPEPPPHLRAPRETDPRISGLLTRQDIAQSAAWLDPRLLQLLAPPDRVGQVKKWYAQKPKAKPKKTKPTIAKK